jgi:hypothetical protein
MYTCWDCLAAKGTQSQLHNVWWQQIPIPHCSWGKGHLSGVNTTGF